MSQSHEKNGIKWKDYRWTCEIKDIEIGLTEKEEIIGVRKSSRKYQK